MSRGAHLSPNLPQLNSDEFAWSFLWLNQYIEGNRGSSNSVFLFSKIASTSEKLLLLLFLFFPFKVKQHWLGENYLLGGHDGNEITKTNVPDVRAAFRYETLVDELHVLSLAAREQRASAQKEVEVNGVRWICGLEN